MSNDLSCTFFNAVEEGVEALVSEWLLPNRAIRDLPESAVSDVRECVGWFLQTAKEDRGAVKELRSQVSKMRSEWVRANIVR